MVLMRIFLMLFCRPPDQGQRTDEIPFVVTPCLLQTVKNEDYAFSVSSNFPLFTEVGWSSVVPSRTLFLSVGLLFRPSEKRRGNLARFVHPPQIFFSSEVRNSILGQFPRVLPPPEFLGRSSLSKSDLLLDNLLGYGTPPIPLSPFCVPF